MPIIRICFDFQRDLSFSNWSMIAAFIAIFISLGSLSVSMISLWQQRKHNRLLVKPAIEPSGVLDLNKLSLFLKNDGLGPARLLKYQILLDNKEISHDGLTDYLKTKFHIKSLDRERISPICIWPVDYEVIIFSCTIDLAIHDRSEVLTLLDRVSIKIVYESLYNEKVDSTLTFSIS